MAYDTLIKEAKDLPEDMIEQVIDFMRFLKYASNGEKNRLVYDVDELRGSFAH